MGRMRQSYAKIRKNSIRRKSDGLPVIAFDKTGEFRREDMLVRDAHKLAIQGDGEEIHGYAIVTWDITGRREHAYNWKDCYVISPQAIPQFVAEGLYTALLNKGYINGF